MQKLDILKCYTKWIRNIFELCCNNKTSVVDSFQFLSSSLDNLVKNQNKYGFKYLSQEFDNNLLDLVKQKGFYPYEYMVISKSLKKNYLAKKTFIVP